MKTLSTEATCVLLTTRYLLTYLLTCCLPLTTYCLPLPLTFYHLPLTTCCLLLTAYSLLLATRYLPLATYHLPLTAYTLLLAACCIFTCYVSYLSICLLPNYLPVDEDARGEEAQSEESEEGLRPAVHTY